MKRKHIIVLALLGLLSIVVLAVPELGILPMLVIIGIPISIAYWSVPALFLIATISYVIYHAMVFPGGQARFWPSVSAAFYWQYRLTC